MKIYEFALMSQAGWNDYGTKSTRQYQQINEAESIIRNFVQGAEFSAVRFSCIKRPFSTHKLNFNAVVIPGRFDHPFCNSKDLKIANKLCLDLFSQGVIELMPAEYHEIFTRLLNED